MAGPEKKSRVVTPEEKKLTAYHEAGHAVAGFYCKHHPRVHEITIIPRGQAGGYTMYLPEKDRSYVTKGEMFEDIVSSLGGRVAEQLILEDISTGASNDLQQATNIARQMITRYGFSERLGPVVYGTSQEETFLGRDFGQGKGYSETTAAEIDSETRDIIDEAYETCRRTLTEHIDQLHALAKALMEREKLNEEQFNTIMAGRAGRACPAGNAAAGCPGAAGLSFFRKGASIVEENFNPVAQTRANYYTPGSPVQFVCVELLKGDVSGEHAVCLTFKNISRVTLTALEIHFKCKGVDGVILCEDKFEYRDLQVKPGELFGQDDAVFITAKAITSVDVTLCNVYNGKRVVHLDGIKRVRLPAPRRLAPELQKALEARMNRTGLKYQPQVFENGWYCACGAFHPTEEDTVYCSECGCDRILLQNALNTLLQPAAPADEMEMPLNAPAAPAAPAAVEEPTRIVGAAPAAPAAPVEEPTRVVGAPVYEPKADPIQPVSEPTRVLDASARAPLSGAAAADEGTRVIPARRPAPVRQPAYYGHPVCSHRAVRLCVLPVRAVK